MLTNYAKFSRAELSALFGESNLQDIKERINIRGISTDTRNIEKNNLFAGIKGDTFDGNSKALEAMSKGASAILVNEDYYQDHKFELIGIPLIRYGNTIEGLGLLAQHHRRKFKNPVIAIGGSNGKTTTKEITSHILSSQLKVLKTTMNYNNQIGVPLTLLQLSDDYDIAVIEIGTNEPGEISKLSAIVEPTHGLITNIGKEHLEKLIDLDGVELEETFLFGYLKKSGGKAFINYNDERLREYYNVMDYKVSYGTEEGADLRGDITIDSDLHPIISLDYEEKKYIIKMKTFGYVSGYNALAAITLCIDFKLSMNKIIKSLENYETDISHEYARMGVIKEKDVIIINDCYNANPESMKEALFSLKSLKVERNKFAVLGDMREMGQSSEAEHTTILDLASDSADKIFIIGKEMKEAFEKSTKHNLVYNENQELLIHNITSIIGEGDAVLVKGSRGMKMEKVINALLEYLKK